MGKKSKAETDHLVSSYLQLPIRDLADAVAEMEMRRAVEEKLRSKLAADTDEKAETNTTTRVEESSHPEKLIVHCRSGFHAR